VEEMRNRLLPFGVMHNSVSRTRERVQQVLYEVELVTTTLSEASLTVDALLKRAAKDVLEDSELDNYLYYLRLGKALARELIDS
jgi:hypothetical protein